MDLTLLKTGEFLELLASDAPAPGGGAAAAIAGGLGASLIGMVAELTKGKKKYAKFEEFMVETAEKAAVLRSKFNAAANRDAQAFGLVSAAYKMLKETPEQITEREAAICAALKKAADAPLELMELSYEGVSLCEAALDKSNINVLSDLKAAAVLLRAAAQGAFIMVEANLSGINDTEFVIEYRKKSGGLLEAIENMATKTVGR